jgi:hypothetical protein
MGGLAGTAASPKAAEGTRRLITVARAKTNGLVEEKMRDRTAATFRSFPEWRTHEEQKSPSDSYKGTAQRSAECVSLHAVV